LQPILVYRMKSPEKNPEPAAATIHAMDDAALFERTLSSLRASWTLAERGAPANRLLRFDGVIGMVAPSAPKRSVVNCVVYERPEALLAALDDLTDAYGEADIEAWTVWVPEADENVAAELARRGHALDAAPQAMGLELSELLAPAGPEPDWSGEWDLAAAGLINDRAYGDADGMWAGGLGKLPEGSAHLYLSRIGGEPASMVMVHDHDGDCAFWFAATAPAAQGRGLASGLLYRALVDARERGCKTSTTQATKMGEPVYARLGYRRLGAIQMWERRG
jgi:GNAT superfamily N-acetyltransferase